DLRPPHEEALLTGQAVDDGGLPAFQRQLVGAKGDGQSAQVAQAFVERQRAVHVKTRQRLVCAQLTDQLPREFAEMFRVGSGPPVARLSCRVEVPPAIVEGVAGFVAHERAGPPPLYPPPPPPLPDPPRPTP